MERTSSGTILLAFVAILFGLLGTYGVRKAMKPKEVAAQATEPDSITVPMASTDLESGRKITMGDVAIVRMTRAQLKARKIRTPFMADTRQIIGRTLQTPLERGAVFDTQDLYPEGLGPGVAEQLEPGERAVTVTVRDEFGLIGFAGAGQFVDVLFHTSTGSVPQHRNRMTQRVFDWGQKSATRYSGEQFGATRTLMQRVRVLALNHDTIAPIGDTESRKTNKELWVTLAVTPDQAEVLRVVEGYGQISLSLRHPDDDERVPLDGQRSLSDIMDVPQSAYDGMDVYRGRRVEHLEFDQNTSIGRKLGGSRGFVDSDSTDPDEQRMSTASSFHWDSPIQR